MIFNLFAYITVDKINSNFNIIYHLIFFNKKESKVVFFNQ